MTMLERSASSIIRWTTTAIDEVTAGAYVMTCFAPHWARDYMYNQTTILDSDGSTPRTYCLLGAVAAFNGMCRLAYIPCSLYTISMMFHSITTPHKVGIVHVQTL